ncbi:MAG: hypothetical protein ACFFE4_14065 [Candidatus Thorarchaeota archaeon]
MESESTGLPVMSNIGAKFISSVGGYWKFQYAMATIVQSLSLIFTLIFPDNEILAQILWFISNIFSLVPLILGAYSSIWMINLGVLMMAYFGKGPLSPSYKIYGFTSTIYKNMLIIISMVGFLLFARKLQGSLYELL